MTNVVIATIRRGEPDKNYRTLVIMQRSDRPKYWTFHCINCRLPIAHLGGSEVKSVTDFYNPQDASLATVDVRCSSCKRTYAFLLQ